METKEARSSDEELPKVFHQSTLKNEEIEIESTENSRIIIKLMYPAA